MLKKKKNEICADFPLQVSTVSGRFLAFLLVLDLPTTAQEMACIAYSAPFVGCPSAQPLVKTTHRQPFYMLSVLCSIFQCCSGYLHKFYAY